MTILAALAAAALVIAAVLLTFAHAAGRLGFVAPARAVAAIASAALLPSLIAPGTRGLAVLGIVAGLLPRPLSFLLGAGAALHVAVAAPLPASVAVVVLAPAIALAGAALSSTARSRLIEGRSLVLPAACAGIGLAAVLAGLSGGGLLRWRFAVGRGTTLLALPGPGLLLGLALLAALAGGLVLAAHVMTRASDLSLTLGRRALLMAVGFAALGLGFAFVQASHVDQALRAGAAALSVLAVLTGGLVLALVVALGQKPEGDAGVLEAQARVETRLATALCVTSALVAGIEGWLKLGDGLTSASIGALAVALVGLAALQETRLAALRRGLLLAGLVGLLFV